jgi:dolichol-phosphate mannosyltransferase
VSLPTSRPSVSLVLPALNEGEVIGHVVEHARAALEQVATDYEIIVVDDGSSDNTGRVLDALAGERIRVIHFPENRGYGLALRAGFAAAVHPLIAFIDSDDQFDPLDLKRFVELADQADLIVGYRVGRRDGGLRAVLSRGYNLLVRAAIGVAVRDVNCAFKLIHRAALDQLPLHSERYSINAELLARAARAGMRIREVPVTHRERHTGRSKVGVADVPYAVREIFTLRRALTGGAPGSTRSR